MPNKTLQIVLTKDEYDFVMQDAKKHNLSIGLYVKGLIVKDNEFSNAYTELCKKVNDLQKGTRFTLKLIFGVEWTFSKKTKLSLGKEFFKRVEDKTIKNVTAEGKDSSNTMWYIKN